MTDMPPPPDPSQPPPDQPGWGTPPPGYGGPPPPPGAPGYGSYGPPPGWGPPGGAMPGTNQKAIWALVTGILSLCCGLIGIAAIILGIQARNEVRVSGQQGDGLALAGLIIGIIGLVGNSLWFVAVRGS